MQNHKMFLEKLLEMKRASRIRPDLLVPEVDGEESKNGMDFLTAYKSYAEFMEGMLGFWLGLKIAQGSDEHMGAFFETINQRLNERSKKGPTFPHSPPTAHL